MSMKILLITKNFDVGGAETHVCELANSLVELGHQVFLISKDGNQKKQLSKKVVHFIWKISDFRYLLNIKKTIDLIKQEKFDVIHGHQRLGISMASLSAKLTNTPVIATVHGQVKYDLRSSRVSKRLDKIICVRQTSYREAQNNIAIKDKSCLILNGVKSYPKNKDKIPYSLMYGSRLVERHCWVLLLLIEKVLPKLVKEIPEIKLIVWGDGRDRATLENAVKELNKLYPNLVEYKGFSKQLGAEYQSASLALACARSAMDALVAGTCVLPLNYHHLGEIITQDNYELYKADNFEAKHCEKPDEETLYLRIKAFFEKQVSHEQEMVLLADKIQNDLELSGSVIAIVNEYKNLLSH